MRSRSVCLLSFLLVCLPLLLHAESPVVRPAPTPPPRYLLERSQRTIFLGDSITAGGQYIGFLEAWLLTQPWKERPQIIDCGLSSETVSGLSEEGHAGGKFPRPDLAERIDRVLATTKPDLVFACYGINCGIYQPFAEERLQRYQAGYRQLKQKVEAAGAKLIIITPPFYDDLRSPKAGFSYNEVLDKYSAWLISQRDQGWIVIDLHTPMTAEVRKRRESDPKFTLQPDGVHPNSDGHWSIARHLIRALDGSIGDDKTPPQMLSEAKIPEAVLPLVQQRMGVLRDAYVAAAGHKRPGVAKGLPLAEAEAKAKELSEKIQQLMSAK